MFCALESRVQDTVYDTLVLRFQRARMDRQSRSHRLRDRNVRRIVPLSSANWRDLASFISTIGEPFQVYVL